MPWLLNRRRFCCLNMIHRTIRNSTLYLIIFFLCFVIVCFLTSGLSKVQQGQDLLVPRENCFNRKENSDFQSKKHEEIKEKSVVFIGGMPRSGTTLMRAILDSHPMVHCGEETRVIPRILSMRSGWKKSPLEWNRLIAGGMTDEVLDAAVRSFIYEILIRNGSNVELLCDKDPFVLKYSSYVSSIFPKSKFLLLIRDARAVIHSVMTRKVTITGFSLTDHRQNLKLWNKGIETMVNQCDQLGSDRCLKVQYEKLVLQPKSIIEKILKFLNVPWTDDVLHHEELIGKRISLSKTEHSSDQVIKPINLDALSKWQGNIPDDVLKEIDVLAPMLAKLGYDTKSKTLNYGEPDRIVLDNMKNLKENAQFWDEKAKLYARKTPNSSFIIENKSSIQNENNITKSKFS